MRRGKREEGTATPPRDGLAFAVIMGITILLGRENPDFVYPEILLSFLAFLLFNLLSLAFLPKDMSNEKRVLLSVSVNLLLLAMIIQFSGGPTSYFWVLYLLPVFHACLFFRRRGVLSTTAAVAGLLLAAHVPTLRNGGAGEIVELLIRIATITISSVTVMGVSLRERESRIALRDQERRLMRERAATRETLQHMDRLATMGTLTASITHELNSPLAAVLGFIQLSRRPDFPEAEREHALITMEKNVKRCTKIIKDMLNFSRQEQSRRSPADINELVSQCVDLSRVDWELDNVKIDAFLDENLPLVPLSPSEFQQVIFNLLRNSFQAIRGAKIPKGRITVSTKLESDKIRVLVSDNGPGIPEISQKRIWDAFFTTKGAGEGTGLGLGICKKIVEEQRGQIFLESKTGAGAAFAILLPVSEKPAAQTPGPAGPAKGRIPLGKEILVAEDDKGSAEIILRLLRPLGLPVKHVGSFDEALPLIEAQLPRLMVTDLHMPGMPAGSFFGWLEAKGYISDIRIVIVSGSMPGPAVESFLSEKGFPQLAKPFDIEEFNKMVGKELQKSSPPA